MEDLDIKDVDNDEVGTEDEVDPKSLIFITKNLAMRFIPLNTVLLSKPSTGTKSKESMLEVSKGGKKGVYHPTFYSSVYSALKTILSDPGYLHVSRSDVPAIEEAKAMLEIVDKELKDNYTELQRIFVELREEIKQNEKSDRDI